MRLKAPKWDIRRKGRTWTHDEYMDRIYRAPVKIEFAGGIFTSDRERLAVLAMLLENLGIEKAIRLGNPADWKAAVSKLKDS